MPENFHELGDLLLLADGLDIDVLVHPVVFPPSATLEGVADWAAVRRSFQRQAAEVLPRLGRNAPVFEVQYRRVMDGGLRDPEPPVLGLPRIGRPGFDEASLRDALGVDLLRLADFRVVVDDQERVREVAPPLAAHLGLNAEEMAGWTLDAFDAAMVATFGPRALVATSANTDDFSCQEVTYGSTRFNTVTMATRDETGWLTDVRFHAERLG
jgi:hypothetical protein